MSSDPDQPVLSRTPPLSSGLATYEEQLLRLYGPMLGGRDLARALGYRSGDAMRKAHKRGRLPIRTFELEGRRGRFAATADLAAWIWRRREDVEPHPIPPC
ncbi:hypothetical protein [Lysobacter sp. HA18]